MGLCRDEKEDLLSRLDGARPASPRPQERPLRPLDASVVVPARLRPRPGGAAPAGSGLVRYELLQCEMRELEELEASVLGYQPTIDCECFKYQSRSRQNKPWNAGRGNGYLPDNNKSS